MIYADEGRSLLSGLFEKLRWESAVASPARFIDNEWKQLEGDYALIAAGHKLTREKTHMNGSQ